MPLCQRKSYQCFVRENRHEMSHRTRTAIGMVDHPSAFQANVCEGQLLEWKQDVRTQLISMHCKYKQGSLSDHMQLSQQYTQRLCTFLRSLTYSLECPFVQRKDVCNLWKLVPWWRQEMASKYDTTTQFTRNFIISSHTRYGGSDSNGDGEVSECRRRHAG